MKVKCNYNNTMECSKYLVDKYLKGTQQNIYPVKVNREYTVYDISFDDCTTWYLFYLEDYSDLPLYMPSFLFSITDKRLSRHWVFNASVSNIRLFHDVGFPALL